MIPASFRREEGLNQKNSLRIQMRDHSLDRAPQALNSSDIRNRAEEARDHVKPASDIKLNHVSLVQWNAWTLSGRDRKHVGIDVYAHYLVLPL
jgi:hypothetical protein